MTADTTPTHDFYIKDGDVNSEKITQKIHYMGSRTKVCSHCKAMLWPNEKSSICCQNGLVTEDQVPPMIPLPDTFRELYYDTGRKATEFRRYINSFNNAFCMTTYI